MKNKLVTNFTNFNYQFSGYDSFEVYLVDGLFMKVFLQDNIIYSMDLKFGLLDKNTLFQPSYPNSNSRRPLFLDFRAYLENIYDIKLRQTPILGLIPEQFLMISRKCATNEIPFDKTFVANVLSLKLRLKGLGLESAVSPKTADYLRTIKKIIFSDEEISFNSFNIKQKRELLNLYFLTERSWNDLDKNILETINPQMVSSLFAFEKFDILRNIYLHSVANSEIHNFNKNSLLISDYLETDKNRHIKFEQVLIDKQLPSNQDLFLKNLKI